MIVMSDTLKNGLLKVAGSLALMATFAVTAAPHTHGEGTLQVLQAGSDWQLVLQLPAADVLGFEHKPDSTAERHQFKKAESTLSNFKDIFSIDASCSVVETTLESPWQEATEHKSDHREANEHNQHGHHEEHDEHKKEDNHATHSDFRVAYLLACESPISKVEVSGFEFWPSVSMLRATWITQTNQQAFIIKASEPSFEIK
ncbi:hypothetical protein KUC3_36850 [Alteromonas sp. KC3]|nr:hypothetical protein KUC3_36850 [Alteromonas sp. KC3]BCO24798.1 hypothetical protein KUC14_36670 [Alteromonas sp. KC14]